METVKAIIYITGLAGIDKPEKLKYVKGTKKSITDHIKKLQKEGYCEKGDRVSVSERSVNCTDGKKRLAIEAYSSVDFSHTAVFF